MTATQELASVVGRTWTSSHTYDERDVMLYALSVGAQQLRHTTENSEKGGLLVLPGFLTTLADSRLDGLLDVVPLDRFVHQSESFRLTRSPAIAASVTVDYAITDTELRRSGTAFAVTSTLRDSEGEIGVIESMLLARHDVAPQLVSPSAGRPPEPDWGASRRVAVDTRSDQALLFRLNGDRNPLHSDPAVAVRAGFDRPILHGLCTFGVAVRVVCETLRADVAGVGASFVKPVLPGDRLVIEMVTQGDAVLFRVLDNHGDPVLARGHVTRSIPTVQET